MRSIAWQLVVLALAAGAPFAALTAYLAYDLLDHQLRQVEQSVLTDAQGTASDAERLVDRARTILADLATRPGVASLDPDRCDPLLADLVRLQPRYANVFTVNAAGVIVCSARGFEPGATRIVDSSHYLDPATRRKTFTISKPATGRVTGKWVVVAAQPIVSDKNEVRGVVGISFDLIALSAVINKSAITPNAIVAIIDSAGIVLTRYPDAQAWAGRDGSAAPISRMARERRTGTGRDRGVLGIERIWGFAPVRGTDWTVLSGVETEVALAPVQRSTRWIGALGALSAAFAILLGIAVARPISRPLSAIAKAARRMSETDSIERLAPQGPAEVASLAADLNGLLERRLAAERDLGDTAARLRETQRSAQMGTWRYLPDGSMVVSDQMAELFQLPPGTRTYAALLAAVHPDDRAASDQRFRQTIASDARYVDVEYRVARPDGQVRTLQSLGHIRRDVRGDLIEASGTVQDVTERKHASELLHEGRQRLQGIVHSAMDAIVTIDADQRITLFNPAAERMFAVDAGQMLGRPLDALIPDGLRSKHAQHVARFGETGGTSRAMGLLGTVQGRRSNGEEFPLEAAISQITVGGRKFYTAILRDVTERVQAENRVLHLNVELEQRVKERTAELEAANRELHAFDYSISHDLRAPVNRIRGFGEALLEGHADRLDDDGRDLMRRIHAAAESMDQLISDMLALSTIARGDVHRSDVDMSTLARNLLASFQRTEPSRQVDIHVAADCRAEADPGLMRIALENLLGNAWKFSSRREAARIDFGCVSELGEKRFFVRDNGAGFDLAKAGQLFEPFRRLHSQAEFRGTGIGLATVQRIFRRHGGRIWAESAVGAGATFWFTTAPAA
jgi:PAS domain S-box-containing protein